MALSPGARLGPYEVLSALGAGGMGEVYKARDTRLDRTVAIKVLNSQLADAAQFRERFDREAKAISQLSHPHICTLHDIGRENGADYLVMEYLEGQTLAQRLVKGVVPLDQALQIAIQIADALDKAHRCGIVHRDLKPSNIMLTRSGAKLLDFGLAKAGGAPIADRSVSTVPTTSPLTAQGTILGTLQYMAPEQLEGKEIDGRADIFSFGAIVYEMVTGTRVFDGASAASVIAGVLKNEPLSMSAVQSGTPRAVDRIVTKCLAKAPDDRWQTARDLCDELKWVAHSGGPVAGASQPPSSTRRVFAYVAVVTAALIVAVLTFVYRTLDRQPETAPSVRIAMTPPKGVEFGLSAAVSPDGRWLAFIASSTERNMVWVRALNALESQPLAGTADASYPFWSPDSRNIGFFADGKLKTIEVNGSVLPRTLGDAYNGRGGTWAADGTIIYAPGFNDPLYRVSASGGDARPLTTLDRDRGESSHRWPWLLPDGRHYVFLVRSTRNEFHGIYVGSLESSERTRLIEADSNVQYAKPGYLLFLRGQSLVAQAFDSNARMTTGEPLRIAEGVRYTGGGITHGIFAASDSGTLVYVTGEDDSGNRLVWVDRSGKLIRQISESPRTHNHLALSSDGRHIAVSVSAAIGVNHLWLNKIPDTDVAPFTFGEDFVSVPIWSRNGTEILWSSRRRELAFFRKPANGSGREDLIWRAPAGAAVNGDEPTDWSPDGQHVLFQSAGKNTGWDVWVLPLSGNRKAEPLIQTPSDEGQAQFSPNGRWIAYTSNESGRLEVYVQAFPPTGPKSRVSNAGGMMPAWRADGRELFYLELRSGRMMAADIESREHLQSGKPHFLFQLPIGLTHGSEAGSHYGVAPDGQRFLVGLSNESPVQSLNVIVNWTSDVAQIRLK